MSLFYTRGFYERNLLRTEMSAQKIVPFVMSMLTPAPAKMIDLGCGRGVWLRTFQDRGVAHVEGRDGPWVDKNTLLIGQARFRPVDFSEALSEEGRFDLAMSLEVAEHLDTLHADRFVGNLTALSDTILFSAATEGQGGRHHVNERPLSWWAEKFAGQGYKLYDVIRPRFWNDDDVCWWYRQNMVMFCNGNSPYRNALEEQLRLAPGIVDMAHPAGFQEKARLANLFSPEEYVGLWLSRAKQRIARLFS